MKADVHLARVALVLAETDAPGQGGAIDRETIERAALIVQMTLDCWRALPEHGEGLGLSRRDQVLNRAVAKLAAWLDERPDRAASRREIQRACVAGARKPSDLDALLTDYEETYPGSVTSESPSGGGLPTLIVAAPPRRGAYTGVGSADTDMYADEDARTRATSDAVGQPDTASADTGLADTVQACSDSDR